MTAGVGNARGSWRAVAWAVLFASLTSLGLGALAWFLVAMDTLAAIGLGLVGPVATESGPGSVPMLDAYGVALVLGIVVNLLGAVALAVLTDRTVGRSWPPWVTGLVSAGLAHVVAVAVQLIALGIDPVEFLTAF